MNTFAIYSILAGIYYEGERRETTLAAWREKSDWALLELIAPISSFFLSV